MFVKVENLGQSGLPQPAVVDGLLHLALSSGDERLTIVPESGRNRYRVPPCTSANEVWFASSTASPISERSAEAVRGAIERLFATPEMIDAWPESLRRRLADLYGIDGSEIVLAGSGTEAELIVLGIARNLLTRPITNILVAPAETGSGVPLAAGGRHFLNSASCDPSVLRGTPLHGLGDDTIDVDTVDIRDASGVEIEAGQVDRRVAERAERAVRDGRDVIVHCLDSSKTGLAGLDRLAATALRSSLGERCIVVVDACQLRCTAAQIRRDLAAGFVVMITGSKFAAGPPFSGAVLLPPCLVARLRGLELPPGLASYSARDDWPAPLQRQIGDVFRTATNLALLIRWEAALTELERYERVEAALRQRIVRRFGDMVVRRVANSPGLRLLGVRAGMASSRTIFPVMTVAEDAPTDARRLHERLAERGYHVGQPVAVGSDFALRVCLAAPHIADAAERLEGTDDLDAAMAPVARDLADLFEQWSRLRECR